MSREQKRREAYEYIKEQMVKFHGISIDSKHSLVVSLNELAHLKEGLADPSTELIGSLKELLKGFVTEADIDEHLVKPFQ